MSIKGSKTEQNLLKAFAGESQARTRYTLFSSKAKKEGYVQISKIFLETAEQERAHAAKFFKFMEGGDVEITATFQCGPVGTTSENLKNSADGEYYEYSNLYPQFANTARDEGFDVIAKLFESISVAEKHHEEKFRILYKNLTNNKIFERDKVVKWICSKCGYIHEGKKALDVCPACFHPKAYFEILSEN